MKYEPKFTWDNGTACCVLNNGERVFIGLASCHPDDKDMMSEKTGCEIAYRRAKIQYFRYYRDTLKAQLKALNQLYYSMNKSNNFNPNSYENKMLQRQIKMIDFDLAAIKSDIADEELRLRTYIDEKEKFYTAIRARRKQAKS